MLAAWAKPISPAVFDSLSKRDFLFAERAILAGDEVLLSPISAFIVAHCRHARGMTNEAVALFWSMQDPVDIAAWDWWTAEQVREDTAAPIAHYFRGDALARQRQWALAVREFTFAAAGGPSNKAMALHARGIAYIGAGEMECAEEDLIRATDLDDRFIDAQASLGHYWLLKRAAPGALKCYQKVLDSDPDGAVGLNGRGCAFYGLGEWDRAEADFKLASTKVVQCLANYNVWRLAAAKADVAVAAGGDEAAMSLNSRIATGLQAAGSYVKASGWNTVSTIQTRLAAGAPTDNKTTIYRFGGAGATSGVAGAAIGTVSVTTGSGFNWKTMWEKGAAMDRKTGETYMKAATDALRKLGNNPNGVRARAAMIDKGEWPVNCFGLFYAPTVLSAGAPATQSDIGK